MAIKKQSDPKAKNQELPSQEKREEARIKMFMQLLDVKGDTNMTRFYSAMQSIKKV